MKHVNFQLVSTNSNTAAVLYPLLDGVEEKKEILTVSALHLCIQVVFTVGFNVIY